MSVRVHVNVNGLQDVIEHERGRYVERNSDGDLVVLDGSAEHVALYPPNYVTRVDLGEPDSEPGDAGKWTGDADNSDNPEHLFGVAGSESLAQQVVRLAEFITENIDGEPSQSQGAIDTAIRIMSERLGSDVDPTAPGRVVRISGHRWQVVRRRSTGDGQCLVVELVPYDESRSTVGPVPAEVHADPTDDEVAHARATLDAFAATSTQAGDSPVDDEPVPDDDWPRAVRLDGPVKISVPGPGVVRYDGQRIDWFPPVKGGSWPSDGYLDDAETWTPEQPVPPTVLALMRIDRVIGNEYALTPTGLGRVRGLVLDALNAWSRDDSDPSDLQERVHELEEELPQVREALMRALTDRGELRARFESMKGKRDRARGHAVRNERERDEARAERDALLEEREYWIDRQVVETLRAERDEARAERDLVRMKHYEAQALARRLRADFETRARDGRTQVEALVADNQRLQVALDAQNHATDDLRSKLTHARATIADLRPKLDRALADGAQTDDPPSTYRPALKIGDRVGVEDGEGKGVIGRVESFTTAPGGIPFVIIVGDDGH